MNKYEIMFIVKTTIDEQEAKKSAANLKSIITDMKGEIIEFKEIGQKKLAYPIKKEVTGFYYLIVCNTNAETILEFERKTRIDENILRHLIINLDKE
ncbi:MAG: 30S ribosomal protein S6 [Bacilli bacterium]|nr:30S ribosomal protein S6 [Bacilli bacterium]MDD3895795.1 30S ribosomal protein S6 [Bacilli bacterium]MDD4407737.1 30S ribosomal protein S6 [Bacilli bacterium]